MSSGCGGGPRKGTRGAARGGRRQPAQRSPPARRRASRSVGRRPAVWAHGRVRTGAETRYAGPRELPRRGLEMPRLDALDRGRDHAAAALQVVLGQRPLAVLLQPGRPADAEDVLSHAGPSPVLRVPERQEPGLEAEWFALLVKTVLAREVVERELHVIQLRPEVHLVGEAHRLARAGLVVDYLDLAVAHVVDPVDLADHLGAVDLQAKPLLDRERAHAAD